MYWQVRAIIFAVITIILLGAGWKCYVLGKESVQRDWDAEKAANVLRAAEEKAKSQDVANTVATSVAETARKERTVYRTILKEVDRVQNCPIDPLARVLHDAAATATVPDTSATGANAASVTTKDLTETVVDNYESCRDSIRRLEALQEIIRQYNGRSK